MTCEHFGRCGGCAYLDISYEEELEIKRDALVETLGEYSEFLGKIHPAPGVFGYRNKMEFAFGDEGANSSLTLGIRKKRSFYEVAPPNNCVLVPDDFKAIAAKVTSFFRASGEMFFHRKRHTGALRHLVLRRGEATGEILVLLSATSGLQTSLDSFAEELLATPLNGRIAGILHAVNDGVADAVKNENVKILYGRDYFYEEMCGLRFKISQFSFFQTNSKAAEILYGVVREFAGAGSDFLFSGAGSNTGVARCNRNTVGRFALDLYCGTGTIAQIISPDFEKVAGVEIVEDAILAARENALANGITNCEFHAGDAFEVLENLAFVNPQNNVIIADPPRDGLHPKALAHVAGLGAPRIVYVACKPKSLARDLPVLIEKGYQIEKIAAVDMFPRTPHIECVVGLSSQACCNPNLTT